MAALGFSTFVEPCATAVCRSSGESLLAGARPGDFGFAVGTSVRPGPLIGEAPPPATAKTAAAHAVASTAMIVVRLLRLIWLSPLSR
jgi:hypothetical protein